MKTASTILRDAQVHICERHKTRSMIDIFKLDESDYAALRILDALHDLVIFVGPNGYCPDES